MGRPKKDPALLEQALALVRAGMTPTEAAAKLGGAIGKSAIYAALKPTPKRERAPKPAPAPAVPKTRPIVPAKPTGPRGGSPEDDLRQVDEEILRVTAAAARALEDENLTRYGTLARLKVELIEKRASMRPPPPPKDDELERGARPLADEVLRLIERPIREAHARMLAEGLCPTCRRPVERPEASPGAT